MPKSEKELTASEGRMLKGEVVSDKMDKTIVVKVTRTLKHPVLGKTIRKSKKYKAHDQLGEAKVGDWVEIIEGKPISKTKHMVLKRVVAKAD